MSQGNRPGEDGPEPVRPDYGHALQVFGVVAALLVLGAVARAFAVPPTFGELGWYRAASVAQEQAPEPRHLGSGECVACHDLEAELHAKDTHARVSCETCHGPGGAHVAAGGDAPMRRPSDRASCLTCHRRLVARPAAFPQIDWRAHYRLVGVADEATECVSCHSPHEPLFLDRDLREARRHPLVHRCRDCHQGMVEEAAPRPEGHPEVFECGYCHAPLVDDFEGRPHQDLRCTTCHLFIKDTEFSGRIVRDADPRFCLLCHGEADFRSADGPAQVAWPGHREDMSLSPEDETKRCIDCHRDRIHLLHAELTR